MKVSFVTLGCKVNSYDTQCILEDLKRRGYTLAGEGEAADVYVVNTCAVTNESERKSRQLIRRCKAQNPEAAVVVTGCYSQTNRKEALSLPEADIVTGTHDREQIPMLLEDFFRKRGIQTGNADSEALTPVFATHFEEKTRAVVKIQDGCRMFCSYCVIPYARGEMRSADSETVLKQIQEIVQNGYQEVSLTGIHLASYKDGKGVTLIELMEKIGEKTTLPRLRLGSLEPKLLTEEFLSRLSKVPCFCPHFHISLQSGCDSVLKNMNRRYTSEEYYQITRLVFCYFPQAAITTDIIVGFPGETEEDFAETQAFVEKVGFAHVHVFPYSPKKGTPAASLPSQLSHAEKHRRVTRLMETAEKLQKEFFSTFVGKKLEVLMEKKTPQGEWEGLSENYIRVRCKSEENLCAKVCLVSIKNLENGGLTGNIDCFSKG